jgi:hypothetical protein
LRERWIVALATLYFIILIGGSLFIGQYALQTFENQTLKQNSVSRQPYPTWTPHNTILSNTSVTLFHHDDPLYQGVYKPHVITTNLTAQDYRGNTSSSSLHIGGWVNNTGDGIAWDALLHVVAMNKEGVAVDTNYSFTGITAHVGLGLNFELRYTGSPLTNCTVSPLYNDHPTYKDQNSTAP